MTTRRRSVARPAASRFGRYALAAATSASGAAALAAPSTARADFSSPYSVNPPVNGPYTSAGIYGNWTATFTGATGGSRNIDTTSAPVSLSLSDSSAGSSSNQLDFNTTIAGAGSLSFDYNYAPGSGSGSAQYVLNGTATTFPAVSGTITIPSVAAGNTFGFRLGNYSGTAVSLTISNFAAPVPEPTVNALIAVGAIGLLGLRETRRRRQSRAVPAAV